MSVLDFIFPKKCVICKKIGSFLCSNCFSFLSFNVKNFCLVCKKPTSTGLTHLKCKPKNTIDGCFSALSYNKTAKKLIYNFKQKPYLTGLKDLLGDLFYESIIQNEEFNRQMSNVSNWVIVPISMSKSKLKSRGYNQAEIIARQLSKKLKLKYLSYEKSKQQNSNVILVDDFIKTGDTFLNASIVLKEKGRKKVIGLALAS